MALQLNKAVAVKIGECEAIPRVNAELRLRIGELKFQTETEIQNAREVMASAFGSKKDEMLNELNDPDLPIFELQRLQVYLQGGDNAVAAFDDSFCKAVDKLIDKGIDHA